MKQHLGREIGLLMLPVLLLGVWAWWKNREVDLPALQTTPINFSPERVEFTPFQKLVVTPLDVWSGTTWKARTTLELQGETDLPANLKSVGIRRWGVDACVFYRRGTVWKPVASSRDKTWLQTSLGRRRDEFVLRTNFAGVPADAAEVRLRGRVQCRKWFSGTLPFGWKPPRTLKAEISGYRLNIESKSFDLSIKAPNEMLPVPRISRRPLIELRGAKWYIQPSPYLTQNLFLHLHHLQKMNWNSQDVTIENARFFDAGGREIILFDRNGTGKRYTMRAVSSYVHVVFSQLKSGQDIMVSLLDYDIAPRQGWNACKQPLRIEMDLSDGTCWPTHIRATFRSETATNEKMKRFGAVFPPSP